MCICHAHCSKACQYRDSRRWLVGALHPLGRRVFANYVIMLRIQQCVDSNTYLNLLLAYANPLQQLWHFCSYTNILTI